MFNKFCGRRNLADIARDLGRRIQSRMEYINIRAVDLSERTGLSRSQISRILGGTYGVTLENLLKIASALRCEPQQLLPMGDESLVDLPTDPATKADVEHILAAIQRLAELVQARAETELRIDIQERANNKGSSDASAGREGRPALG